MGCTSSSIVLDDGSTPVFHVWNVDEFGRNIKSCQIQVTSTDLVLHQRGESPILWPLQSLRRYGFDSNLFSFEIGRHCSTGPGIYAFKCKRAASLFNILQEFLNVFSESDLGLSSTNGPENGSSIIRVDSLETVDNGSRVGDIVQDAALDYGDSQPSTSTGIKRPLFPKTELAVPSSPKETIKPMSISSLIPKRCFRPTVTVSSKKTEQRPSSLYPTLYKCPDQTLPRCCTIGTCVSASNQHYLTKKAISNTTCGSCRTCSLNMCVTRPSANYTGATDSEERARQADYGNVLDPGGHPRQCVHCCCDFKPSKQMSSCSADDCPLHFNNCVDQITNYVKLDERTKQDYAARLRLRKRISVQQPVEFSSYAHLYTHISTPTKKWPFTEKGKSSSWRSLPHFQPVMPLPRKLAPKRSISHFYSNRLLEKDNHHKSGKEELSKNVPSESRYDKKTGIVEPLAGSSNPAHYRSPQKSLQSDDDFQEIEIRSDSIDSPEKTR